MKRALPQSFFNRDTKLVARDLLGKFLVRKRDGKIMAHMITEVEVYDGFRDRASHASKGETPRNAVMFGHPGYWYVYFTYGIHWMLNIVTREEKYPAAILIRGVEGISGPARLTKQLAIHKTLNTQPASKASGLWIEDRGVVIPQNKIKKSPRVGVLYAGPYWAKRRLRFFVDE